MQVVMNKDNDHKSNIPVICHETEIKSASKTNMMTYANKQTPNSQDVKSKSNDSLPLAQTANIFKA